MIPGITMSFDITESRGFIGHLCSEFPLGETGMVIISHKMPAGESLSAIHHKIVSGMAKARSCVVL